MGAEPHEITWVKPLMHIYKLNIDAAFSNGTGGAGAVLRDHRGEAMAGAAWPLTNLLDASTAEATALQQGLMFIEKIGATPVIIETDSLELSQAYNGVTEIWSPYSAIITDCFIRAHRIGGITVQHCRREANMVAHKLARHVVDSNLSVFCDSDPPSLFLPDVMNDVSIF